MCVCLTVHESVKPTSLSLHRSLCYSKKATPGHTQFYPKFFDFLLFSFYCAKKQTNRKVNKKQKRILLGIVAAAARQFFWILELSGSKTFHIFETTATYIYSTSPDSHPYKKLFLKKVQIFKETKKQENHMIVFK